MKLKEQKIKYKQIPPKEELIELYKSNTLQQIANFYGTTKTRVRKWFDNLEIEKRPQGGGNNRKFIDNVTETKLIEFLKFPVITAGASPGADALCFVNLFNFLPPTPWLIRYVRPVLGSLINALVSRTKSLPTE